VMGFADLPEPEDEDAEGEPDIAFYHHGSSNSNSGHSSGKNHTMSQGYNFTQQHAETLSASGNDFNVDRDEDADGVDEAAFDDSDGYGVEEVEDDDCDGDFVPHTRATSKNLRSLRSRSFSGRSSARYHPYGSELLQPPRAAKSPLIAASSLTLGSSAQVGKPRKNARSLPVPVPVPNLTKKSRGRRVPTMNNAGGNGGGRARGFSDPLGSRIYLCDISGCGKCFARGEHLKRHIRSIHTNEKRKFNFSNRKYPPSSMIWQRINAHTLAVARNSVGTII
jgi:uncharacterized Zn-finger protein